MANRCFWLSTTEVALHILTGGDCLQSHHNVRLFTRQLQWACQQCKRLLNHEGAGEDQQGAQLPIQAVRIQIPVAEEGEEDAAGGTSCAPQPAGETPAGDEQADGADSEDMQVCTTSTNTADDYAHRGPRLQSMPYYIYRMYVRRVLKPSRAEANALPT